MEIKLNEEVWALGLTIRNVGTQHTNGYYLPVKAIVGGIHIMPYGRYYLLKKKNPPTKVFRKYPNTNLINREGFGTREMSRSWQKVKRVADRWNEGLGK